MFIYQRVYDEINGNGDLPLYFIHERNGENLIYQWIFENGKSLELSIVTPTHKKIGVGKIQLK